MRSPRWRHVLAVAGMAGAVSAQPSPPDADRVVTPADAQPPATEAGSAAIGSALGSAATAPAPTSGPAATGSATATPALPPFTDEEEPPPPQATAEPTPVSTEPLAVPDWVPGPAKFAVTPFENHTNGKSLEWIIAEAPFEIAAKSENVLGLEATLAPLYVPGERVAPEADTVAEFAKKTGAAYVVTGWFDRLGDNLRIAVLVWKADKYIATVVGNAQRVGPMPQYHKVLGEAMGEAWTEAGIAIDAPRGERLTRALSHDIYPVFMMGRGLGHFTGALAAMNAVFGPASGAALLPKLGIGAGSAAVPGPDLKSAEHDLERAVFLDPKLFEAQRVLGELYMSIANGDAKLINKATGKFNYAADLAPDDIPSLRAAAFALVRAGKHDPALQLFKKLVGKRPWDLEARYELGASMWHIGDARGAERQLEQVTKRLPDHLQARRVLVLIHASRNDVPRLIRELEAIQQRAPNDLEIKADLATAYGAVGQWSKAIKALESIAARRPNDLSLLVRIGDAHRRSGKPNDPLTLTPALAWYHRAAKVAPDSSLPGFAIAQALVDAGRVPEAQRMYTLLLKYTADKAVAEHALGVLALRAHKPDDAAWYLRQATRSAPRVLESRRALVTAELTRKDPQTSVAQAESALAGWPQDGVLLYLAGLAHALAGDAATARERLGLALKHAPTLTQATAALATLNGGGAPVVDYKPELLRPWGDGAALQRTLDRYEQLSATLATTRKVYQGHVLSLLGVLGQGPQAVYKAGRPRTCPVARVAPTWSNAQQELQRYARLGIELESAYRFIARHDDVGLTASLLPNSRTAVASAKKRFRTALADIGELRAEWTRGIGPELRASGCSDKLIAAAIADPQRYRVIQEDKPEPIPPRQPPRPKPRTTFFVDNTRCADPVEVWIDGSHIGQVAPGRRGGLVADGGERSLCLLLPGSAQCGDRGTLRQVYLHDGWSTTLHCPK